MRKVDDGKKRKEKKRMAFLVATTSLPAVYRPNDDRWNAARWCQYDCYNCYINMVPILILQICL